MTPNKNSKVRVRFAPSPTGGLHLGGVRTALFNYLFARQHGGTFILRMEDTDRSRFVPGAEEYIESCLAWCGLSPDESRSVGGPYGPYRQSERKANYLTYAQQLVEEGRAYYAFDSQDELEKERLRDPNFKYGVSNRRSLNNSLSLNADEVQARIDSGIPYAIRIKVPEDEQVIFHDLIRGRIQVESNSLDDKVLLKADGMPTYHLAVVVDDFLMEISHVFRGEEWLPSAPVHVLLWRYLGLEDQMPAWLHLPLILKPEGNGKLSKRDGDRLGFPVFAITWTDPKTETPSLGFREMGFVREAFLNMLAMLGWNDGTEKTLFSMPELINAFSVERISKQHAKFDFDKAKWFNHEWIKRMSAKELAPEVRNVFTKHGIILKDEAYLTCVIDAIKDRCTLLNDFYEQSVYFFVTPRSWDLEPMQQKWNATLADFFDQLPFKLAELEPWDGLSIEAFIKLLVAEQQGLKIGEISMLLRIMLVGEKMGPPVFEIAALLGKLEVMERIQNACLVLQ